MAVGAINVAEALGLEPAEARSVWPVGDVRYSLDPVRWAEDHVRIVHKGRTVAFRSRSYQTALMEDRAQRRIILKPRQVGVSVTMAIEAIHTALFRPNVQILIVSRNLEAAKSVLRYCHQVIASLPGEARTRNASKTAIELLNGSEVISVAGNPDAARSFSPVKIFFDEVAFCLDADGIYEALLGIDSSLTLASTPNGRNNLFFRIWEQQHAEWSRHTIHWSENPEFDDDWADSKQRLMSRAQWAQEYGCDFIASGASVFLAADVRAAGDGWDADASTRVASSPSLPVVMAWDIGRRSDHTVGVALSPDDDGVWHLVGFDRFVGVPYPEIARRIQTMAEEFPQAEIRIESNGIGDPLIEFLDVPVEPWTTTAKSKVQAIQALQMMLEQHQLRMPVDDLPELVHELQNYEWADKHITQDCVMALSIAADAVRNAPGLGVW